MTVDKNVYALSITLDLDSSGAFKTLEEFGQMASNIEENISAAAQNSLDAISGVVDTINQQMSAIVATIGEFVDASSKLEINFSAVASSLKDASSTQQDSLSNLEERLTILEKIDEIQSDLEKSLEDEHKTGEEYLALINSWISALESKNLVHGTEGDMIAAEGKMLGKVTSETGSIEKNAKKSGKAFQKVLDSVKLIWATIKEFDKETEKFVTANYRVYGSQQQLVNNTRLLSVEYGVFREEAIATYKALADVKTPRDEIYKLSATVARANRTTGLAIDAIADYSFQLRGAGFDGARTRKQIDMLSAAQRKFGLSTHDLEQALKSQTLSGSEQVAFFGKDAPEAFMKANLGLRALDKQLATNTADEMMKNLQKTGVESLQFWGKFGMTAGQALAEPMIAQAKMAEIVAEAAGVTLEQIASGSMNDEQKAHLVSAAETMGVTTELVTAAAKAHSELTDEQKKQMMTMAGVSKAMASQIAADKRYQETMETLTAQLNQFKSALLAISGFFAQLIADALIPFLYVINLVISAIGTLTGWITSAIGWMEKWIPGFHLLMNVVRFVGGFILGLIVIVVMAGVALASFATAFATTTGIIKGSLNVIRMVGRAIVSIANAIGQSIRVIFTGLGQGLAALGNAVRPVIIPLMQLGVAVLLVGAGFWLMGMGMAAAAEHGWAAVGMLAAMTIAMIVMLIALAIIATVAGPLIIPMLALAAVMLILGAAVMLAGVGMYFIGMAVQQLAVHGLAAAAVLPALAGGIALVALAGLFGFAGLMLLAVALLALAVPVMLIGVGMSLLATAINSLTAKNIIPVAQALLQASLYFLGAGLIMVIAAPLLAIGAVAILVASLALTAASLPLLISSVLMVTAGSIMFAAGVGLLSASAMLFAAGVLLLPAGIMLVTGAILLAAAAPLLGVAGVLLIPGSILLMIGAVFLGIAAAILLPAAMMVLVAGLAIGIGGMMMLQGMVSMMAAAGMMLGAAFTMFFAAGALAVALAFLVPVAPTMLMVGILMAVGGMALYTGAVAIYYASLILQAGAVQLQPAGIMMQSAMDAMLPAAIKTYYAGVWFVTGASYMLLGAIMLMVATAAIAKTALFMLFSVPVLMAAALSYQFAAGIMLSGSVMLLTAAIIAIVAADLLHQVALLILDSAVRLILADILMSIAAISMLRTSVLLIAAAGVLLISSFMLFKVSMWLVPAAIGIYIGMTWLEIATKRFRRSTDDIAKMGKGMREFAQAFDILSHVEIGALGSAVDSALDAVPGINKIAQELDKSAVKFQAASGFVKSVTETAQSLERLGALGSAVDSALDAMPGINKLAQELDKSAVKFQAASDKFVKPVTEIAQSLERLGAAMANIGGQGLMVQEDMNKVGGMLEKYTNLLEGVSQRIELAVVSKARPAMAAARSEGLEDAVRSDAITTVQVMDKSDGEAQKSDDTTLLMQEQVILLHNINEKMAVGGGNTELSTIVELLETYLPKLESTNEGISTEFNQWMK